MAEPSYSVSVAAVVVDDVEGEGRVLVIQRRDTGAWQPPGGVLGADEFVADGVRREVREETGVEIEVERLTGVYQNVTLGVLALVFRARLVGGAPTPTEEATAVEWWTVGQVEAGMDPTFAVRIVDALTGAAAPPVRAHDGVRVLHHA
ncbi:ADP-ribose pyrophosphatase YjhB, NUDIX family [Micromonospora pattaloongensis]|uniref:ADP-ribose pyrophosphatase YjhB, NUDIX family n=1 Tax=Micromonospora pattaloongensis TaxID=405436 RepID=A0A1H3H135_9ACTN|nr:NUDIX domain-containing protein [Micromonospora pattaloongensis]SDY09232.1 ADP-ribose pyrophosphatase YjhB, NUDIX family [Micromonospora pattaloongensis]